jgi:hypothetical protein
MTLVHKKLNLDKEKHKQLPEGTEEWIGDYGEKYILTWQREDREE